MGEEIDFSQFSFKGRKFFFKTTWQTKEFSIQLTDGRQMWQTKATNELITRSLCPKSMKVSHYIDLVRKTFKDQSDEGNLSVSQATDPNQAKLTWRIKVDGMDNQNVSLRGVLLLDKLQDDRTTQFQNFLEIVITTLTDLEEESNKYKKTINLLEQQKKESIENFQKLVKDKQALETDLYSRLAMVLNSKKEKIRELKSRSAAQINQSPAKQLPKSPARPSKLNLTTTKKAPPKKKMPPAPVDESSSSEELLDDSSSSDELDNSSDLPADENLNINQARKKRDMVPRLSSFTSSPIFDDIESPAKIEIKVRKRRVQTKRISSPPNFTKMISVTRSETAKQKESAEETRSPTIPKLSQSANNRSSQTNRKRARISITPPTSPHRKKPANCNSINLFDEVSDLLEQAL